MTTQRLYRGWVRTLHAMTKTETDQVKSFIADVHEALCGGANPRTLPFYLTELHRIIKMLMDETAETDDQHMKVALATLEYAARKQKSAIEERLAMRN